MFPTSAQLRAAAPSGKQEIIDAIANAAPSVFPKYGITNRNRVLGFLSTALEESAFRVLTENLNYTAARLVQVWPSRFPTIASAEPYASSPRALANKVYGGRMGNTGTDDGWRYRGQGLIQITGKDNFALLQKLTGLPLVAQPDFVTTPEHMLECSVALFVQYDRILDYCDQGAFQKVWALVGTGRANGNIINLANHQAALDALDKALPVWPPDVPAPKPVPPTPAKPSLWARFLAWITPKPSPVGD